MYLKVYDGERDNYYSFDEGKVVVIGRGSSNDISVVCDGVSRVHIEIHTINGEYFVVDKGATNGTFINDERLEKDAKVPFNSFFPVLLGFHAKVHLMDESNTSSMDELVNETKQYLANKE